MSYDDRCNSCPLLSWDSMSAMSFEELFAIDRDCPFSHNCTNMSCAWDKFNHLLESHFGCNENA